MKPHMNNSSEIAECHKGTIVASDIFFKVLQFVRNADMHIMESLFRVLLLKANNNGLTIVVWVQIPIVLQVGACVTINR